MLKLSTRVNGILIKIGIREPRNYNTDPAIPFLERIKDPRINDAIEFYKQTGIRDIVIVDNDCISQEHYNSLIKAGELVHL